MSFWKTFISDSKPYQDAEIEDIKFHLTKLLEAEASLTDIDNRLIEVNRSNLKFGIEDIQLLSATLEKTQLTLRIETWIKSFNPQPNTIRERFGSGKEGKNQLWFNFIARVRQGNAKKTLTFTSKKE